jgi:SAM-dependent methyltransferase
MSNYTGIDNLEIMLEAENYNRHLLGFVEANLGSSAEVLDFGAGSGTFSAELANRGVSVTCVEPDPVLRDQLMSKGLATVPDTQCLEGRHFGLIFSFNVLEHIADDEATLLALNRLAHEQGRILLYVPAFQVLYSSMDRKVGHFRRYRLKELRTKVETAGFKVRHSSYVDSLGFIAALIYRVLDQGDGAINVRALRFYDRYVFPVSVICDKFFGWWFGKNLVLVAEPCRRTSPGRGRNRE